MKKDKIKSVVKLIAPFLIALLSGLCITIGVKTEDNGYELKITYSDEPPIVSLLGDVEEEVLTIEDIDGGGNFQDITNIENGEPAVYYELGSMEEVNTSSPEAFRDSTFGRCITANNYYGAQCVSLARAFWWDYAGFDVSTCGTNLAKGMMNCADENAGDKFKVIWNVEEIQDGTWIVLDGKTTGHVCMAMGTPENGYVKCLGENQGGHSCDGIGGSATNIINISLKNFIGGYTPIDYIEVPLTPDTGINR